MISLAGMSLKQRRRAAQRWSQWRRSGQPAVVTAQTAAELTGLTYFDSMDPDQPVRLTEVAIRSVSMREGRTA